MSSGRAARTRRSRCSIIVYTDDRPGMLNQLTSVLFNEDMQHPHPGGAAG